MNFWIIADFLQSYVVGSTSNPQIKLGQSCINPLTTNVPHDIETSQVICIVNQLTGFCMIGNIVR